MFKQPKSYESLIQKLALADIIDEVKHVKEIEVEGVTFKLRWGLEVPCCCDRH